MPAFLCDLGGVTEERTAAVLCTEGAFIVLAPRFLQVSDGLAA